jgi:uncharacterized protein (TIGR01244 family)
MRSPLALFAVIVASSSMVVGCASGGGSGGAAGAEKPRTYDTPVSQAWVRKGVPIPEAPGFYQAGRLFAGGQPTADDLRVMRGMGVTMVINLRSKAEMADPELRAWPRTVRSMGLDYVHVPLGEDERVEVKDVQRFFAALDDCDGAALVHCADGERVRDVWELHLMYERGYSQQRAHYFAQTLGGGA